MRPRSPCLALAMAVFAPSSVAMAQDGRIEVRPLWGPHYRPGRILPVTVEIRAGATAVPGEVRLDVDVDGGLAVRWSAETPAGGRRSRLVSVVAHGAAPRCRVRAAGLPDAECAWIRPPRAVALVGLLAGDADDGHPALAGLAAPSRAVAPAAVRALPEHPAFYDVLDACVLGRLAASAVTPAGAAALGAWVRSGGRALLVDPDLLRRAPELDAALFPRRVADEEVAAVIPGLPAHFATALRARGLGARDVMYDAGGRPHHVRFRVGLGRGALVLSALDTDDAREAYAALLAGLAEAATDDPPTVAPRVVTSFPSPGPAGWPRPALAAWLALVPLLAWWRPQRPRGWWAAAGVAALVAWALATAAMRPLVTLAPRGGASGGAAWIVHAAAPRAAALALALPPGLVVRPLLTRLEPPVGAWDDDARTIGDVALPRGGRAAWELLGAPGDPPGLSGRLLGQRLVVANETGRALPACLLAWQGRLHDCGPIAPAGVVNVEIPAPLPGPLATLARVRDALGAPAALALRVAWLRADARAPTLLALDPDRPLALPTVRGASVLRLPAVVVVALDGER